MIAHELLREPEDELDGITTSLRDGIHELLRDIHIIIACHAAFRSDEEWVAVADRALPDPDLRTHGESIGDAGNACTR